MAPRVAARVPVGGDVTGVVPCLVTGCDFEVEDDDDWHERLEQHVRWIHVATADFGPMPIPSLFALLANGMIRSEEFAQHCRDVIQADIDAVPAPVAPERFVKAGRYMNVGFASAFAALVVNLIVIVTGWWPLIAVSSVGIIGSVAALFWMSRLFFEPPADVRLSLYPDTTVADDEGDE